MSREKMFELMERYVKLGQLIPCAEDDQRDHLDNVKMILAEMELMKGEIDKILAASKGNRTEA